jgi:hypothetical protein
MTPVSKEIISIEQLNTIFKSCLRLATTLEQLALLTEIVSSTTNDSIIAEGLLMKK